MEISYHFKQRWVQRVVNPGANDKDAQEHINKHGTEMTVEILESFEHAVYLWQGSVYPNQQSVCYFIREDIVMVSDVPKTTLITCYRVDLPFPPSVVQSVIAKSVSEIQKARSKIRAFNDKWIPWYKKKQEEQKRLQAEILRLQLRIKEISKQMDEKRSYTDRLGEQIEEYARPLVASLHLKVDMEKGIKVG